MNIRRSTPLLVIFALWTSGCSNARDAERETDRAAAAAQRPLGSVTILEPTEAADVTGPDVRVRLAAFGILIIPAGETVDGTGHHHLLLDANLSDDRLAPVPTAPGTIVHLDDGSSEFTFENVAPGRHRLIAVVADGVHVPLYPWVVDTITFDVR